MRPARYGVNRSVFARRAGIPTSSKIAIEARTGASARIGGLDIRQPSAPSSGSNVSAIRNRVARAFPNQPDRRGTAGSEPCRRWTKIWAMDPGPAHRYLYVHHIAKSTSQSCRASGTLPAEWASCQPASAPASWIAAVSRGTSWTCPVA